MNKQNFTKYLSILASDTFIASSFLYIVFLILENFRSGFISNNFKVSSLLTISFGSAFILLILPNHKTIIDKLKFPQLAVVAFISVLAGTSTAIQTQSSYPEHSLYIGITTTIIITTLTITSLEWTSKKQTQN